MGMRVDASSTTQSTATAAWQQRQQSFSNLFSSLQSGNLAGAQTALQGLTGGSGSVNAQSPLSGIAQALQAGDLAGAQKAAQTFQSNRAAHHHHGSAPSAPGATTTATSAAAAGPGSLLNVTA